MSCGSPSASAGHRPASSSTEGPGYASAHDAIQRMVAEALSLAWRSRCGRLAIALLSPRYGRIHVEARGEVAGLSQRETRLDDRRAGQRRAPSHGAVRHLDDQAARECSRVHRCLLPVDEVRGGGPQLVLSRVGRISAHPEVRASRLRSLFASWSGRYGNVTASLSACDASPRPICRPGRLRRPPGCLRRLSTPTHRPARAAARSPSGMTSEE